MLLLEVATELREIGLEFCGSAYLDAAEQKSSEKTRAAADTVLEETLRDFRTDRNFRADVFVKAPRNHVKLNSAPCLADLEVVLTAPPDQVDLTVPEAASIERAEQIRFLIDTLASQPAGGSAIRDLLDTSSGCQLDQSFAALTFALTEGLVHPVVTSEVKESSAQVYNLNKFFRSASSRLNDFRWQASPVTGAASQFPIMDFESAKGASVQQLATKFAKAQHNQAEKQSPVEALNRAVKYKSWLSLAEALKIT
jgi:hypothetical protein